MAVTVYRSSDASAPVLDGQVGSLVNLLDKCLVAGYGAKTAAGWTKPYTSGSHSAVFKQGGGNQFYIDVNDNGPGAGTYKEARVRGYEVMTAVATGTGDFPSAAQIATAYVIRKSAAADATTRSWIVIADNRTFYLFIFPGDVANICNGYFFGDMYSLLSGDGYRTGIIARTSEDSSAGSGDKGDQLTGPGNGSFGVLTGHYMARGYTGLGGSVQVGKISSHEINQNATLGQGVMSFPNPTDGGIYVARVFIQEPTTSSLSSRRGWLRGFWSFGHPIVNVINGDTFTGTGDLAGKTFLIIKTSGNSGLYCMEISDTWDTSS